MIQPFPPISSAPRRGVARSDWTRGYCFSVRDPSLRALWRNKNNIIHRHESFFEQIFDRSGRDHRRHRWCGAVVSVVRVHRRRRPIDGLGRSATLEPRLEVIEEMSFHFFRLHHRVGGEGGFARSFMSIWLTLLAFVIALWSGWIRAFGGETECGDRLGSDGLYAVKGGGSMRGGISDWRTAERVQITHRSTSVQIFDVLRSKYMKIQF